MTALLWILWFLAGALTAFGFLVFTHKRCFDGIGAGDKLLAVYILLCFPIGLLLAGIFLGMQLMSKVVEFIERRF